MITLMILMFIGLFVVTGLAVSFLALPILAVLIPIGIAISVISIVFKLVFGAPLLILIIIIAIFYFPKHRGRM